MIQERIADVLSLVVGRDAVCALMEDLALVRGTNSSYTVKEGEVECRQTQVGE